MDATFLDLGAIQEIHENQIKLYGGSMGVRDLGLLESALAMPKATFGGYYLHEDIFEMAAAYLFHLVQNHPFVDGNKRVGLTTALTFLKINGIEVIADEDQAADLVLLVAQGKADKGSIADFLRENTIQR
ncbi:MAG TPA: type II toxin-antitoxin system death-on-curing family toxin [Chloroflexia bacterium]|nr:type II toxin-antitoxin system death-on-curing family toxin [Chloroflexia bacterium]